MTIHLHDDPSDDMNTYPMQKELVLCDYCNEELAEDDGGLWLDDGKSGPYCCDGCKDAVLEDRQYAQEQDEQDKRNQREYDRCNDDYRDESLSDLLGE